MSVSDIFKQTGQAASQMASQATTQILHGPASAISQTFSAASQEAVALATTASATQSESPNSV